MNINAEALTQEWKNMVADLAAKAAFLAGENMALKIEVAGKDAAIAEKDRIIAELQEKLKASQE